MRPVKDLIDGEHGASAAEFALVMPLFLALVLAIFSFGSVLYAYTQLHFATEDAARCYAIKTDICDSAAHTRSYALGRYMGPYIGVDFPTTSIAQTGACHSTSGTSDGHSVAGSGTFTFNMGLVHFSIPLSATACFP